MVLQIINSFFNFSKSKVMFKYIFAICFFSLSILNAQDEGSLLDGLGVDDGTTIVTNAFKSTRVINAHSIEMLHKGVLDFRILHRFGDINGGAYEFFGLDQASMRLSFDFAPIENLTIGVGRSTRNKELDGMIKYKFLSQKSGTNSFPFSAIIVAGMNVITLKNPFGNEYQEVFSDRLSYFVQLPVGRKFTDRFTLQLAPVMVYRNLVKTSVDPNLVYGCELGARFKITNRMALVLDYTYAVNRFPNKLSYNPLSLGVDIETGGHVFQLHFSNAVGMNERSSLLDANTNWLNGEIKLGFNLSRVFQLYN